MCGGRVLGVQEHDRSKGKGRDAWLQRCRACVGDLRKGRFGKLLEMLVESVVMYGAEVWGCCRQLGEVEQVQLRAM